MLRSLVYSIDPAGAAGRGPKPSGASRSRLGLAIAAFLAVALGCGADPHPASSGVERGEIAPPRLVLLYATCTLNRSFLSPYDPGVPYTPHLERFSREAQVFTRHRTEAGISGIAFASIFSGAQADGHGIFNHPTELPGEVELISEAFARNGYEGFFWNRQPMASADLGYGQGIAAGNVVNAPLTGGDDRFVEVLDQLRRDPLRRAFVVTNFTVTHQPYVDRRAGFCRRYPGECGLSDLPEEWVDKHLALFRENFRRFQVDLPATMERFGLSPRDVDWLDRLVTVVYKSNVEHLDTMFGGVLDAIAAAGLLEESLIVFTADHGESMYDPTDDFHWRHGAGLVTEVLDVPLIIRAAGGSLAGRADFVTRSIDVFPTIAGLAGLGLAEPESGGVDLSGYLRGEQPPPELAAFSHSGVVKAEYLRRRADELGHRLPGFFSGDRPEETWVGVRDLDMVWKLRKVEGGEWRFLAFDLSTDPTETRDLFDPGDARHREMARRLRDYKAALVEAYGEWEVRRGRPYAGLSEEDLRRLRSLGYLE